MNRKSLITFLGIAFGLAWILFALPLLAKSVPDPNVYQTALLILFALAMWAPGLGAVVATRFVERKPVIKSLRLNRLGPKRYYLLAWFLPTLITLATLGVTVLAGTGRFDLTFAAIREALTAAAPAGTALPDPQLIVFGQLAAALTIGPVINTFFALGEELGWRGYLLPKLLPLGQWPAIFLSGAIWGLWHAPTTILHGYNFPQHPYLGVLIGIGGFVLLGTILSWLYLKARSPWIAALCHGAFNAIAGLPFMFLTAGVDTALGGSPLGFAGWVPLTAVIVVLLATRQLPVVDPEVA